MLEGIAIELRIVVEVIGVGKEIIVATEYIATTYIRSRQSYLFWTGDFETVLSAAIQCFAYFVTQVGIGVLVSNDLYVVGHACSAMIGRKYHFVSQRSNLLEHLRCRRVFEPTEGKAAVSSFIIGKLTHHFAIGTRVGEHIDKIDDSYIVNGTVCPNCGTYSIAVDQCEV